jgi:hypothetical protein
MDNDKAIAITSIVVSGAVALAAVVGSVIGGWRDRVQTRRLARDGRRANAYVSVLEVVEHIGVWTQGLLPVVGEVPRSEPPLPDDMPNQFAARARLLAFGSEMVIELYGAWFGTVAAVRIAAVEVYHGRDSDYPEQYKDSLKTWQHLDAELKPRERKARLALIAQVNRELSGD